MKKNVFILILVAAVFIFTSCSKLPQAEIDAAKNALEQAKTVQADLYLQNDFYELQDSLNAMVAAIEEQKSKMFGNYKMATENLNEITVQATDLVAKTELRKLEIKTEVASAQSAITNLLKENSQMLELAPKGKDATEALEAIKAEIDGVNSSVSEVPALIESGDLLNAQTKVKAAQEKAVEINNELKTVLEKSMKKS